MKRTIFLSLCCFALLLFTQIEVYACSCIQLPQTPKQMIQGKLKYNQAVFTGKVLEIINKSESRDLPTAEVLIKIEVKRYWKGDLPREIFITSQLSDGVSCGAYFQVGKKYLVYAHGENRNSLSTSLCDFNTEVEKSTEELKILGKGKKPKKTNNR